MNSPQLSNPQLSNSQSSSSNQSKFQWLSPIWLLFGIALLFWNLNYAPLWNPDEGRYAAASLEMAQPFDGGSSDWVVPHLNSVPRLNKPPLVYWLAATSFKVFGATTAAARLPSVLAAIGVLLIVWQLGRRMFGAKAGVLAALVWATSTLPFVLSHTLNTDMLLTFTMALALFGLWLMNEQKARLKSSATAPPFLGAVLAGCGLGLAMLAKGPVGVVLPIGIWGLWLIVTRGRSFLAAIPWVGCLVAFLIAALIASPWYLAIAKQHPEFLKTFLFGENIARLTGSQFYHKPQPPYFYLPILIIGLFPWSAFLIPAVARLRRDRNSDTQPDKANKSTPESTSEGTTESVFPVKTNLWFLWIWALAVVGLFSISSVKLITYILPAFPALALLVAEVLTSHRAQDAAVSRAMVWATSLTAALLLILAIALPIAFLRTHGLADKMMPTAEIAPYVWVLAAVATIIAALLLTVFSRRIAPVLVGGAAAIFIVLLTAAGHVARYEDSSSLALALKPHLKPDDKFVQFKSFDPTVIFYLNRPITVVDVANRSGWEEETFKNSLQFPHDHAVIQRIFDEANKTGKRVFILTKWKHAHFPAVKGIKFIAIINDYRLLSNQPAPAGFKHEYLSPRNRVRELSPECKALSPLC